MPTLAEPATEPGISLGKQPEPLPGAAAALPPGGAGFSFQMHMPMLDIGWPTMPAIPAMPSTEGFANIGNNIKIVNPFGFWAKGAAEKWESGAQESSKDGTRRDIDAACVDRHDESQKQFCKSSQQDPEARGVAKGEKPDAAKSEPPTPSEGGVDVEERNPPPRETMRSNFFGVQLPQIPTYTTHPLQSPRMPSLNEVSDSLTHPAWLWRGAFAQPGEGKSEPKLAANIKEAADTPLEDSTAVLWRTVPPYAWYPGVMGKEKRREYTAGSTRSWEGGHSAAADAHVSVRSCVSVQLPRMPDDRQYCQLDAAR